MNKAKCSKQNEGALYLDDLSLSKCCHFFVMWLWYKSRNTSANFVTETITFLSLKKWKQCSSLLLLELYFQNTVFKLKLNWKL